MSLVHVCWEKTLFGLMYHRATPSLFKTALSQFNDRHDSFVYGELFFAQNEEQVGSFTYNYNPLNQLVRTHMTLWSGHEERIVYRADNKCQVVEWQYSLVHMGTPVAWPCISRRVKQALEAKTDEHIILAKVSPIK